jgi:uncharacterized membrane protein
MLKRLAFPVMVMVLLLGLVHAEYTASSVTLTVYPDGYVGVECDIVPPNYTSQISVPLLGSHVENLFVADENGDPLNFQDENGSLVVYIENGSLVNVSYVTPDLTSKKGLVWTLNVNLSVPFTVVLPKNAVVVDLSDIPVEIAGNSITMPPGNQSISYALTYPTTQSYTPGNAQREGAHDWTWILLGLLVGGTAGTYLLFTRRRSTRREETKKTAPSREEFERMLEGLDLNDDERRSLLYVYDRGGKASQAEVREALGLPKTTAWRMFRRLERKGLVRILKGKKENWVELRF